MTLPVLHHLISGDLEGLRLSLQEHKDKVLLCCGQF